jgi:diguanylate cyclase (GGDEF)-like protein
METTPLILANVLLFALSAGVMLANAKAGGAMRGAVWFAGANLCRGAAMLVIGISWLRVEPLRMVEAICGILSMTGMLLLQQSFAELLEHKIILRKAQIGFAVVVTLILFYFVLFPSLSPVPGVVLLLALGILHGLVAVFVLRFSDDEMRPLAWITTFSLGGYALLLFIRAFARAYPDRSWSFVNASRLPPVWLLACLLTTTATAFGFMSLSAAKLKVELVWRAQVDDLTGLLNRWALKRTALREIQHCRRTDSSMAVVMMDLDGLKIVNDTKGHSCGDVVLQAIGGILQETVRARDSVARIGGDEFCVLLPQSSLEEAVQVAERLREEIYDLVIRYRGEVVQTQASLGVACSDVSGLQWQSLVEDSDAALYQAKRNGKNRVIAATPDGGQEAIQQAWSEERRKRRSE